MRQLAAAEWQALTQQIRKAAAMRWASEPLLARAFILDATVLSRRIELSLRECGRTRGRLGPAVSKLTQLLSEFSQMFSTISASAR